MQRSNNITLAVTIKRTGETAHFVYPTVPEAQNAFNRYDRDENVNVEVLPCK